MLLKKLSLVCLAMISLNTYAQQVAKATNVNMVTSPGTRIVINGGITFTGTSNFKDSGQVFLLSNTIGGRENWLDSTATGVYDANSNGKVIFSSDSLQYIYGLTKFYDMRLFNDSGANLNSDIEVRNQLDLDKGILYTIPLTTKMYVSNPATTSIATTSSFTTSHVKGRLERAGNVTAPFYLFPVGKDSLYAPIKLTKATTGLARYTVEYFPATPFDRLNVISPPIDHISDVEYWEITSDIVSGTDDDANVALSWRGFSHVSSNPLVRDSLLVAQYINNGGFHWEVPGGWVTGNANGADSLFGYVTANGFTGSFNFAERRFTIGTFSKLNLLPLKLVSFTAAADGHKVRLNWDIRNDQEIVRYEVEKSLTGTNFTFLHSVTSLQKPQWIYTDFDTNPAVGWNYYRLKIIDKYGHITYSDIRRVRFEDGLEQVKIFPVPTTDVLNIQLPTSYTKVMLQLISVDGKLISAGQPTGNIIQLNVRNLPGGTYVVRIIKSNGEAESYPFIKQ